MGLPPAHLLRAGLAKRAEGKEGNGAGHGAGGRVGWGPEVLRAASLLGPLTSKSPEEVRRSVTAMRGREGTGQNMGQDMVTRETEAKSCPMLSSTSHQQ